MRLPFFPFTGPMCKTRRLPLKRTCRLWKISSIVSPLPWNGTPILPPWQMAGWQDMPMPDPSTPGKPMTMPQSFPSMWLLLSITGAWGRHSMASWSPSSCPSRYSTSMPALPSPEERTPSFPKTVPYFTEVLDSKPWAALKSADINSAAGMT